MEAEMYFALTISLSQAPHVAALQRNKVGSVYV